LLDLIAAFSRPIHMLSFSWGGASAMLLLAQKSARSGAAVNWALSPVINPGHARLTWRQASDSVVLQCDRRGVAELVNRPWQAVCRPLQTLQLQHICS